MKDLFNQLKDCHICPRECDANRYSKKLGYCKSDADYNIAAIVLHKGEEPMISGEKGICNVFFSRCNLQCIYCQNHQISCNKGDVVSRKYELNEVVEEIISILDEHGINSVGFVSPSHYVPHVIAIIDALRAKDRHPITVYNTNAYDSLESIELLESYISVYLPDLKYKDKELAKDFSDAKNYPKKALKAIREMYRQKGSTLIKNDDGLIESGLIIRHLVLPGHIENSLEVLRSVADELSEDIALSIMAQYHPVDKLKKHPELNRKLTKEEYELVVKEAEKLGFHRGWIQELESAAHYLPDFEEVHPFE
ncbi:MAG: radical SAM protein [Bacteroidetes bacterium]|nr:radical SAM protein [Bacteroidota bacterium]